MNSVITLTTDFGISDPYVGMMKGIILTVNPAARVIDLSHSIEPQNLVQAGWVIKTAFTAFPAGTVHVIVVDPGVGTDRRIIAVEAGNYIFLAPDNGVLTFVMEEIEAGRVYHIDNRDYFLKKISRTFHGRDIFAPVSAHISTGIDIGKMGTKIHANDLVTLDRSRPHIADNGRLTGSIMNIDRFGNLTTDISKELLKKSFPEISPDRLFIQIKANEIKGLSESYQNVEKNFPLAIIGSSGFLEIALNCGSAASFYQASAGDIVTVCVSVARLHHAGS
ncbi:MAG: SAM-dependent chlorinase/fluorinase [Desulfobacterales bacterium]